MCTNTEGRILIFDLDLSHGRHDSDIILYGAICDVMDVRESAVEQIRRVFGDN